MSRLILATGKRDNHSSKKLFWMICFFACLVLPSTKGWGAAYYDMGSPILTDIWVDPLNGNNSRSGASRSLALQTLTEALNRVPVDTPFTATGYRIMLVQGDYPENNLPGSGWIESRQGTHLFPMIIEAADGPRSVRLHGYLDINRVGYFYLIYSTFAHV
jgi:hypothetical protein